MRVLIAGSGRGVGTLNLRRFTGFALAAAFAAGALACDGKSASRTPDNASVTVEVAASTPVPTPIVNGNHLNSTGVGYEADMPAGWRLNANILTSTDFRGDAFFKPTDGTPDPNRAQVNITVGCEPPSGQDLAAVLAQKVAVLRQLGRTNLQSSDRAKVDGRDAKQIDYTFRANTQPTPIPPATAAPQTQIVVDRRDVIFLSQSCTWTISLSTPGGEIADNARTFDDFLSSFRATA